jgi:predicted ATPase/DNA-binding SARP family transcriptional activator
MAEMPATSNPTLTLRLFGTFEACVNGAPLPRLRTRKGQQVLALLAIHHDRETHRARLAELLWPESDSWTALENLRRCLTDLRRALGPEARRLLAPSPRTLCLDLSDAAVDLIEFDKVVSSTDAALLERAVTLYRAPFVETWDDDWAVAIRLERDAACLRALEMLSARALQSGDGARAVGFLRRAVALNPLRESAQCALIEALAACGDCSAATVAYREFRERLHREMHVEPAAATTALYRRIQAAQRGPAGGPPASAESCAKPVCRMPQPATGFVGREREVQEVSACVGIYRVVTLAGPGGIGKTRLAIATALSTHERFQDGAWFVDLSSASDGATVLAAFATALRIREQAHRPLRQALMDWLARRIVLLVVDNCEHVSAECSSLLQNLMESCPGLRVLATSREPLGLGGERVWRVHGLSVPHACPHAVDAAAPQGYDTGFDAVRLFVSRAATVEPGFEMDRDPETHSAVGEICRALEGNALSIELAAALVGHLSVSAIAHGLEDRLTTLAGRPGSSPPRHQSLRSTLDWSYGLLSEAQRALLRAVSVFAGGFKVPAAEAVFAACGGNPALVLELTEGLVSKSLLALDERNDEPRFSLHETVRQYGRERLAENGEESAAREAHAAHFQAVAEEAADFLQTRRQVEWLAILDIEHDNMLAALAWSREHHERNALGLGISGALARYWSMRGQLSAGRERLRDALMRSSGDAGNVPYARALNGAGSIAYRRGEYTESIAHHKQALDIARRLSDNAAILDGMFGLARAYNMLGDYAVATVWVDDALQLSRALKNRFAEANLLISAGVNAKNRGAYAAAEDLLEEALRISRETGVETLEAVILHNLGNAIKDSGDVNRSRACFERSLSIHRRTGDRLFQGTNLFELAAVARAGDNGGAGSDSRRILEESLALCRESGNLSIEASCLHVLGGWALHHGDIERAVSLHRSALEIRRGLGTKREIAFSLSSFGWICAVRGMPEDAARMWGSESALREEIRAPAPDQETRDFALRHASAREACGPEKFGAAWNEGRAMTIIEAMEYALAVTCQGHYQATADCTLQPVLVGPVEEA